MTDRSDQLASPTLSRDKEEGFTNTQPHTSNGPLAVGNPYEAIDCVIKPSGTAFALTTRTAEYHNIDRETTTVLSRASSSESLGGVIDMKTRGAKDQVDVPIDQMEVIGRITPPSPIPSEDIQPENGLGQHNLTQLNWSTILTESSTMPGLPTDLSRPCPRPNNLSEIPITIDSTLTRSLRKLALEHETDLGIVVVAGWSAVLARLSGQDDTIINFVMENSAQSMDDKVLPLQIDLSGEPDTTQLLGRVQKLVSSVMAPQDMELDLSSLPQVGLRWYGQEKCSDAPKTAQASSPVAHLDLQLQLHELDNEVNGFMQFSSALFDTDTIKRHIGYLTAMLGSMSEDKARPVAAFDILSSVERTLVLETWNMALEAYPDHLCYHQIFELQANKAPDATAIVCGDRIMTYGELNSRANRIARQLIDLGVQRETRIALCVERTPGMIVGILAIMKAGGAYVPLDPSYPSDRIRDILQDASPTIAVADRTGQTVLSGSALTIVEPNTLLDYAISNPVIPELTSRNLAYIIYTSGSTGKPKGVMIEHRGVVNLAQTHTKFCGIRQDSRVLQFASLSFDASVWDIVLPLSCGASLYLPNDSIRQDRDKLWEYMARNSMTHASFTPSFLQDGENLPPVKTPLTLVLGGEPLGPSLARSLVTQGYNVINDFGPTESTVSATTWRCPPDFRGDIIPIGRPVIHSRIYILDKYSQPVPLGAVGEMYVGGIGVARGYLNRPDLTEERFLPDPFSHQKGARMYKTGDLVRHLPDGNLLFLGRKDDQVKIRGFRIELGEIEATLSHHPAVTAAAVIVRDIAASKQLVAYVVARPRENLVQDLRSYLVERLPAYMVPAAFVRMDALPLTANDKLDRKALPTPNHEAFARESYEAPQNELEVTLASIWEKLLGIDNIGRHDNFFVLGGHSLLVVRMLDHLRRLDLTVSVRTVYDSPVLHLLAQAIGRYRPEFVPPNLITPQTRKLTPDMLPLISLTQEDIDHIIEQTPGGVANIQDIYSLLPLQDGILFHHLLTTEGDPYLLSAQMAFDNRPLLDRYLQAFQQVVDRHDILRTAFIWKNISMPAQIVWRSAKLPVQEITLDTNNGPIMKQLDDRFHPNHYRIDLTQAPLLRFMISQDTHGRWVLYQLIHHLIGDHAAAEMMNHEVELILRGQEHSLPATRPFRDAIARAHIGTNHDTHEKFFKEMLSDIEESTFPFGVAEISHNGAEVTESHSIVPEDLNNRLRSQAKRMGISMASLCHVAWAQVLARTTGQERVVFGTVLFGGVQNEQGAEHAMGLFINTLPFRCDIGSRDVQECVRQTHKRLAELLEHEHASLPLAQKCSGVPAGTPLFSSILNYLHTSLPSGETPAGSNTEFISQEEQVHYPGIEVLGGRERTNYPFALTVEDFDTALGLTVQTLESVDPSRVSGYMKGALEALADALENNHGVSALQLEILPLEERNLLLQGLNSRTLDYPQHQTIHCQFEEQVKRSPNATALVFMDQSLTYAELNQRANRLANQLIGLGVKPDTLVAICVDRSIAMIVGILAILKSGGAYVPLDPTYASNRLRDILDDAKPAVVLVDEAGRNALGQESLSTLTTLDPNDVLNTEESNSQLTQNPQVHGLTSRHLAYVIFTSGSTGKPKGVMIEHHGVVNLVLSRPEAYGSTSTGNVALFPSFGFDSSVVDIFTTLTFGGTLHLLPENIRLDRVKLWQYLHQHSISQTLLPPAILQGSTDLPQFETPLTLVVAGEALPLTVVRTLQSQIPNIRIVNDYGPTEGTVSAITWKCPQGFEGDIIPIGRPVPNKKIYILDSHKQPVPLGAAGELYIGGAGIARGYLNKPELTSASFLPDPFSGDKDARMYKTGDLAQYLPDGNIVFLGRNDHQVKIRGFRIELGEIETRLVDHALVDKAVVIAVGTGADKKLVGYVVSKPNDQLVNTLRAHLTSCLPDYMVPAAIVRLDSLPLTSHGKVDRKALPAPDGDAFARQDYEAPQGETERNVAQIWSELLKIDRVSRNDNFFSLGGHSLLAVQMIERLRRIGLNLTVRALFKTSTLSAMVQSLGVHQGYEVPPNVILPSTTSITPEMLPLIKLTQSEVDRVVSLVPGGVSNVQDIYALSPLQEGILFHHLLATKGDPYLLITFTAFDARETLDRYLEAMQKVVDRQDIFRTAFVWENVSTPAQVVWRKAHLSVTELRLDSVDGPIKDQLMQRFDPRLHRIDLSQAPLLKFAVAQDADGRWLLVELFHHLVGDHSTREAMFTEIKAFMEGQGHTLPSPQPFRNLIAQSRSSHSQEEHEKFFTEMLADIDTPSLPYGLKDVHGEGDEVTKSYQPLSQDLNDRLRRHAKQLGVSVASLCHLAWGLVVSRTSGEDRVVFGTVLFGRMQSGPGMDSAMGLFMNTLPLRVDITGCVRGSVMQTHERLASLLEHEHASLVLAQRCSNVPQGTPLFSTMLNYRHDAILQYDASLGPGIENLDYNERTNYPLTLSVEDYGVSLGLTVGVVRPFDSDRICGYMHQTLQSLADALDHAPDMPLHRLEVLPKAERQLQLQKWNSEQQDYPIHLCIHHLFEQQVERTPQATSLVFKEQSMSYSELNDRVNSLAYHLIGLGVKPDTLVAICVERSFAMIVGLLAILKAGGAYVPLDPAYTSDRLRDILQDASPSIVVADEAGQATLGIALDQVTVVNPNAVSDADRMSKRRRHDPVSNPQILGLTPRHTAYTIYTSGSTGKPKGVLIEHQGAVNLIYHRPKMFGLDPSSRVLQFTSLNFDHSVSEIFAALSSGACLHLVRDDVRLDHRALYSYIGQHGITHVSLTPTLLQDSKNLPVLHTLKTLLVMGEALSPALVRTLQPSVPNGSILNSYGPTETTVSAIVWRCPQDFRGDIVPIGRPLPNKTVYLLDKHRQPVPIGAIGEIYIGGAGVGRGYLNRPELTAEVFLPDPFANDPDARMYKSGDMARYLLDGNLVCLGRNDHQVKIRGFRIELGEIEARLSEHSLVEVATVVVLGSGGDRKLVAYVVTKPQDGLVRILRSHLTTCLPDYMVPTAIVRLDSLPLTSNGKIDRKALPAPDSDAFAHQAYEEPQDEIETMVAQIWAELLNLDRVGRNDSFFALGGHSLLAVRLMNRISTFGVQLPLSTIFSSPSLSSFAECFRSHMDKQDESFSEIAVISRDGELPLSFSQQRMWFLAQMEGISETYHVPVAVRLYGEINREALQRALDAIFARHEALRSVFVNVDGQPQVRLLSPETGIPIRWEDLRGRRDSEAQLKQMCANEVGTPFDLTKGPLIRALVAQLDSDEYHFLLTQHHIVSDGWSSAIFNYELSVLYDSFCRGESDPLPPLEIQYPDYAAWQRQTLSGSRLEAHTSYWRTTLADAPVLLNLPTDRPRPPQQSFEGDEVTIRLNSEHARALRNLSHEHGATLYMTILAAWSSVLSRLSGQDDVVIGSPVANRNHYQIEPLIGFFVNSLALRVGQSGDPTVRQLIDRVRMATIDAQAHQDLPFEQVVEIVQPPRSMSHAPLFQVMFVWQNDRASEWNLPGIKAVEADMRYDIAKFDLTLELYESDDEIVGALTYSTALFDRPTMERHVDYLQTLLKEMANNVDLPIASVELLGKSERDLLLDTWNETRQEYPTEQCIHQLFEQQAERIPQSKAFVYDNQSLTYAELNERANRLANQLIGLGVKPDTLVAICVDRSIAMIVGILAILKSGGAYVPLDPTYASNRLRDILDDATPAVVLVDEAGRNALGQESLSTLTTLDPNDVLNTEESNSQLTQNPQVHGLTSRHLAYVIFTSGSTGKPKGVMIEHHGVVNLVLSRPEAYGSTSTGNVALFPSFGFDSSVVDIFTTLTFGGTLHLLPENIRLDRVKLWQYLHQHSISQTLLPPAILQGSTDLPQFETPLTLVVAGEALPLTVVRTLQSQIPNIRIVNDYGPTEGTVSAITWKCPQGFEGDIIPIGRPVPNKKIYILDSHKQPVPLGAAGELYIGGAGIARGYLNKPELTSASFLPDPFSGDKDARMYKTGDLAQYQPDGNIVFLGRNDHQVKIRGFRIELGEIETRLVDHALVDKAVVIAVGTGTDKKLVGYVVSKPNDQLVNTLRAHLTSCLPDYMVPAAIVRLDSLPLTSHGKVDRKALPAPDGDAFARQDYEAPQGETERNVAQIWSELLKIDRVSRNDNFFSLGGHSLLAVQMIERLRRIGLNLTVRALFKTPTLSAMVQSLGVHQGYEVPPNVILPSTTAITPEMLPLINLTQSEVDHVVSLVPGGVSNVQDIYALSPLQEGILFHHLLATKGDPYLLITFTAYDTRETLDRYMDALQKVVDRQDIFRTAFVWENVSTPAQVVWRQTRLSVTELQLDAADGPIKDQLMQRFDPRLHRIDLSQAPLLKFAVAQDADGRWLLVELFHHLVGDHSTREAMFTEIKAFMEGQGHTLPSPQPFRNLIAQSRSSHSQKEHEKFFTEMLADIDTPSLPFGLKDVHGEGDEAIKSYQPLPQDLNDRLRRHAKQLGVSVASLCHHAWGLVVSRTSGEDRVVFGTVLFGRMQSGPGMDSAMGLFMNTLPLRVDITGCVRESVMQTHERLASLLEHEHASLVLAQKCSNVPQGTPLFSTMLNYRHNTPSQDETSLGSGIEYLEGNERTNYPLTVAIEDFGNGLGVTVDVVQPLDPVRVCGYMHQAMESLADALDRAPEMEIGRLEIVPVEERKLLLQSWNSTQMSYPAHLCIHQLFEQQAERIPQSKAFVYDNQSLTYAELNERANHLANQLIGLGVKPDTLVAICVDRSIAMIVGILAILKSGGAYVPLDPTYASNRLRDILDDAKPAVVLVDEAGRNALGHESLSTLTTLDPNDVLNTEESNSQLTQNPQVHGLTSRHLAYVIFTSGSTGKPKGVMIEHHGVVNLVLSRPEAYGSTSTGNVALFPSFGFDSSVVDIFTTLTFGGTLHLVPENIRLDRVKLWQYLHQHSISQTLLPPAILQGSTDLPQFETPLTLVVAGEALPLTVVRTLQSQIPNIRIVNDYGPTEGTVSAITWKCPQGFEGDIIPIGRPVPNKKIYILDSHKQPVPLGAAGELYIGGAGIARGYLNKPELTSASFLPDPFSGDKDARMYKTGDLAQYLPDGNIVFLGRNDHQVKIRGFRIELGEIETRLVDHALVDKAVVIAVGTGTDKKLVGYVVSKPNDQLVNTLRAHLTSCLPDYMVPAAIVRLDTLPLTSHGKVDRKALPAPDGDAFARQDYEAPQGEAERNVAQIWSELLKIDRVSRNDNFFSLGGHSLLAVQMIERLRRIGLNLTVRALFKTPTLSAMVQSLGVHQGYEVPPNVILPSTTAITPEMLPLINLSQPEIDHVVSLVPGGVANVQDIYSLSPLQEGILFHHLLATKGDPYLLITFMSFDTRGTLDRYLEAMQMVADRQDILRTAFVSENLSTPAQVVWRKAQLSVTELELDPMDGPIKDQLAQRFDPRQHRIDLRQAPLLRFAIAQDADGRWYVAKLLHHLIGDHSTLEAMTMEVKRFMEGQGHTLAPPQPFRNLIAQARSSQNQGGHKEFFTEMLADIDTPSLPFGLKNVHGLGDEVVSSYQPLPQELNDSLRRQAKQLGVSVASLCHLAWALVLSRTSGEERVVFGTVLFGRMDSGPGTDNTMGLFINTLPLRVDVTGGVRESVMQTHERLASLLEHEHASLVLAQQCSNVPQGTPLFSAVMNYRHDTMTQDDISLGSGIEYLESDERTNYPLALSVEDFGTEMGLTVDAVCQLDPARICGYVHQALQSLSDALDHTPGIEVHRLEVLSADERELLKTWNSTQQDYPAEACIHHLFEQHAEKTPQATALVFKEESLTYAELNERANRLAHHLIELGVQPDTLVAICVGRSVAMVVGVLAILKAGGAYVPLDPTYASERLRDVLTDASPSILIADETGRTALGESIQPSMIVVDPNTWENVMTSASYPITNPQVPRLSSSHLAYIIYTSGSTGKPKGVMIEHRGVVNLVMTRPDIYGLDATSRVMQFFSMAFDGCAQDMFMTLCLGGSLHVLCEETRTDFGRLWDYLDSHSITQVLLTPTVLENCLDFAPRTQLRTLIVGGEALSPTLLRTLQSLVPNGRLVNDYGPTETTVDAIAWKSPLDFSGDIVPVGRPIANKTVYLLDKRRQPVPLGAVGEIYIGGVGIARGYLNRPELTAKAFLPDEFSSDPDARMYRTGDMARHLPDGNVVCLGRSDHQVKIRGFRIELGEIEARLADHALVQMAVVIALGQGSTKQLVAYVVAKSDDGLVHTLRSYLGSCLPDYMVPTAFVRLDELPLTSNGKLDRRQLPEPDSSSLAHQLYEPPRGDVEVALATIWIQILQVDKVGRHDNFFMLGGHSLLAVRMINQIKSLMGFKVSLSALFEAPTIAELVPRLLSSGNAQGDAFDVLLPIQPRGARPPLFCIHHGFGLSWSYIGLAKHLHTDQPIYGIQMRGFFDNSPMAGSLDEMALDYIDQIRRIQPCGPYHLLGYSLGGMIAHSMVAHLETQGEQVSLLAVMDSIPKIPEEWRGPTTTTTRGGGGETEPPQYQGQEQNGSKAVQFFANRVQEAIPDMARPLVDKIPHIVQELQRLGEEHMPLHCKSGMVLFRAMKQEDAEDKPLTAEDWRPYVAGEILVHDVDCVHNDMDQAEPLAKIGGLLAQRLEEIIGGGGEQ